MVAQGINITLVLFVSIRLPMQLPIGLVVSCRLCLFVLDALYTVI